MTTAVGIWGLGTYLPPNVRENDYWPPDIVAGWSERMAARVTRAEPSSDQLSAGAERTLAAMAELGHDPFRGAVQRRIMPDGMTTPEMEARAAREAIERAGLRVEDVDVILTQTMVPEQLNVNQACVTHRLLGLPTRSLAMATDVQCNAFAQHATLAQALIVGGQARHVLSVHSMGLRRVMRQTEPDSAWFGDGAAAAVFGPVSEGRGLLAANHHTDGTNCDALVLGKQDRRWWEDGEITLRSLDRAHTRGMLMTLVDRAGIAIAETLGTARLSARDVGFYACHQGTAWLTRVTQQQAGLEAAATVATFPQFGNLSSANIPLILAIGEREGMLRDDAVVVTFSGGVGETWSSLCFRWGR